MNWDYSIVPQSYEKGIPRLFRYVMAVAALELLTFVFWLLGLMDGSGFMVLSFAYSVMIWNVLFRILPMRRISESRVRFLDDRLEVYDKKKRIWRRIFYGDIKKVRKELVYGWSHGYHGIDGRSYYVVIYTGQRQQRPELEFAKHYKNTDYFMIVYSQELWECVQRHLFWYREGNVLWIDET